MTECVGVMRDLACEVRACLRYPFCDVVRVCAVYIYG